MKERHYVLYTIKNNNIFIENTIEMLIKKSLSFTRIIKINYVQSRLTICRYNINIFL